MTKEREGLKKIKFPLIVIVGPTAVGKTEISIRLALRSGGEIISADSRLFYRGMDIGTAKPTLLERNGVLHHLIDVAEPTDVLSLAVFQQEATRLVEEIIERKHLPFLVGGTGQYIHAMTQGWQPPGVLPNSQIRHKLEDRTKDEGYAALHDELRRLDPDAAEKIDPRNVRRTIRALEVIQVSGKKFSEQSRKGESRYNSLTIGLTRPREELYARVDRRIEDMFAKGLMDEVRKLIQTGCTAAMPTMSAIGYRECIQVLSGQMDIEEAKMIMRKRTRIFIRRQANWFNPKDPNIHWFDCGETSLETIERLIRNFLKMNG